MGSGGLVFYFVIYFFEFFCLFIFVFCIFVFYIKIKFVILYLVFIINIFILDFCILLLVVFGSGFSVVIICWLGIWGSCKFVCVGFLFCISFCFGWGVYYFLIISYCIMDFLFLYNFLFLDKIYGILNYILLIMVGD